METFSALLALCEGNPRVTGRFSKRPRRRALMFSLIYAWPNGWLSLKFGRAITHHPYNVGSLNLDQRCKTTLLWVDGPRPLYGLFHSLNPLYVYWSGQRRVIRRLTSLLLSQRHRGISMVWMSQTPGQRRARSTSTTCVFDTVRAWTLC